MSCELLKLNPRIFFTIAKRVSSVQNEPKMMIPDLEGCSDIQTAEKIAEHFSAVSNQYKPVNLSELPVYLPALKPPQVTEYEIYQKLRKLKSTKSTNPLDLPVALRKEYDIFLASPLTDIINTCLKEQIFPDAWKMEIVTPIPKIQFPHNYSDLRKISCTSDYSKLFESVLKEFILKDINSNLPLSQYGGRIGVGTEHLIVNFIDRVLNMLDSTRDKAAVLASAVDWTAAFDRVDPTKITQKFIKIGIRPSLIPILISYLSGRKMVVKFKNVMSSEKSLVGGSPQGTLLGGVNYIIASCDNCDQNFFENCKKTPECYPSDARCADAFSYYDDLSLLELILLSEKLTDYDVFSHVPSDVTVDQYFINTNHIQMQ